MHYQMTVANTKYIIDFYEKTERDYRISGIEVARVQASPTGITSLIDGWDLAAKSYPERTFFRHIPNFFTKLNAFRSISLIYSWK